MNLLERHLNLVWAVMVLMPFAMILVSSNTLLYIATMLAYYVVSLWIIEQKGRNLLWIVFPISAPLLRNKREPKRPN